MDALFATRLVKIAMVASTALFASLVAVDNVIDYGANHELVRHTLSMDTTNPGNALMARAITNPILWSVAYWGIIAAEAATGILLAVATIQLAANLRAPASRFNAAKAYVVLGVGLGFLLWFTGFTVVGGEWFAMWQSKTWNGLQSAFRFYASLMLVLIFVNQPDGELDR